jgi:hypothetical protein
MNAVKHGIYSYSVIKDKPKVRIFKAATSSGGEVYVCGWIDSESKIYRAPEQAFTGILTAGQFSAERIGKDANTNAIVVAECHYGEPRIHASHDRKFRLGGARPHFGSCVLAYSSFAFSAWSITLRLSPILVATPTGSNQKGTTQGHRRAGSGDQRCGAPRAPPTDGARR